MRHLPHLHLYMVLYSVPAAFLSFGLVRSFAQSALSNFFLSLWFAINALAADLGSAFGGCEEPGGSGGAEALSDILLKQSPWENLFVFFVYLFNARCGKGKPWSVKSYSCKRSSFSLLFHHHRHIM